MPWSSESVLGETEPLVQVQVAVMPSTDAMAAQPVKTTGQLLH